MRLAHLYPGLLPSFSASNPVHHPIQVVKDPVSVYLVWLDICQLHPSEGGLGVPNVETRRDAAICISASWVGSVHKTTRLVPSGRKILDYPRR